MESLEDKIIVFLKTQKRGAMPDYIARHVGASTNEVSRALDNLTTQGKVLGKDPFAYDPEAAHEAEGAEKKKKK